MRFVAPFAGIILIVWAALSWFAQCRFIEHADLAAGRVVSIVASGSHPEISFRDKAGRQVMYPQGGMIWGFSPGDPVIVYYSENDPERTAIIKNFGALWGDDMILFIIGTFWLIGPMLSFHIT